MQADIWNKFDFKTILFFSRNLKRQRRAVDELSRVGLHPIPLWKAPNPYQRYIEDRINRQPANKGPYLDITLNHQQMVRLAYDSGAKRGLFMEDDICFLKDESKLKAIIDSLPDDADLAYLDWFQTRHATDDACASLLNKDRIGGYWVNCGYMWSAACYSLSRRGMEEYLNLLESPAKDRTKRLMICDHHWKDLVSIEGIKAYCAVPCACIQGLPGGATPYENEIWRNYARSKIRREDYSD